MGCFSCEGCRDELVCLLGSWGIPSIFLALVLVADAPPQTRELTDGTLAFGDVDTSAVGTRAANSAHFWANQTGGSPLEMAGTFEQTGNDVVVHMTPVDVRAAATTAQLGADNITMHLTLTDSTHASGTMVLVDGVSSYEGDVDAEKYPD